MSSEAFRLAHHDSICANGGNQCADRDNHARRNMSDDASRTAATLYERYINV